MFLTLFAFSVALSSCGLSPCDCAEAAVNDDNEVWSECEEKMEEMSFDEKSDFQNRMIKCINP